MPRAPYLVYTDGSCKAGDDAPGGWGYVVRPPASAHGEAPVEAHGKATRTQAKIMELRAVAEAVAILPEGADAVVHADNQSLVVLLTNRLAGWLEHGVRNVDPLLEADAVRVVEAVRARGLRLTFQWVRGHAGNAGNLRADALAAQGAREAKAEGRAGARRR